MNKTKKKKLTYDDKLDLIWNQVSAYLKKNHSPEKVRYSAYPIRHGMPVNNLNTVAIRGRVVLVGYRDEFYGGFSSRDYQSPVLTNPTWLQLCLYANEMILTTNDHHHCFLEAVHLVRKKTDYKVYEFDMGS